MKKQPKTKKNKKKTIVVALVILLLIIAILVYFDYSKWNILFKKKVITDTITETKTETKYIIQKQKEYPYRLPVSVEEWKQIFPLKLGDKNYFVGSLQTALNKVYGANINVDNDFGDETQKALLKFKKPVKVYFKDYANIWGRKDLPTWMNFVRV